MAMTIGNLITLDGQFADWPSSDSLMTTANTVAGYQVYGALLNDSNLGNTYVIGIDATNSTDPVLAPGTIIYLNTDQNTSTGYNPFGAAVGAEYEVQFANDTTGAIKAYLYSVTSTGTTTLLNGGAPLNFGISSNGESVEVAIPQSLLTPAGGTAPHSINFDVLINNGPTALPTYFGTNPQYVITDPSTVTPTTTIGNLITLDGQFADWPAADSLMTPGNTVAGFQVYGALLNDSALGNTYVIGIDATSSTDPVIGAGTVIYLNTDQNTSTGFDPFGAAVGAEYEVRFEYGSTGALQPNLYSVTSTGATTLLNGGAPLKFGTSSNGESVEVAIPQSLLTPSGGTAPHSINFDVLINNGAAALPGDFNSNPQYVITDPSTLVSTNHAIKKVGIVYSATTAALYFGGTPAGQTAYADLFLDAQHQAEAAGVSYDILTEADLTKIAKLAQYSALIFPDMQDVQSNQVSAIVNALSQVVYNYHVPIITAGEFLTNDQTGAPLPGNPYINMQTLLNLTQTGFGTATYSVTADPTALANHNPVMASYTSGELIGGASGQFPGTTAGYYTNTGYLTFSGVTQPATVLADINIQNGATLPGVVQTTTGGTNTHFATTGLLGDSNLLQHAIQNAVFGTTPSLSLDVTRMAGIVASRTDMDQSQFPSDVSPGGGQPGIYDELIPILQQWKQQYNFVGSFFINVGDNANPANQNYTNWSVSLPYYQAILALGSEIGNHSYTHLINPPTVDANGNPVPIDPITGVSTWNENTNTLYITPPANGSAPNWTFNYEFGQSKTIEQQNIKIAIAGAAVPGANDWATTAEQIMAYYRTVAGGLTGYVTGGWTGVGSGYPNAFGYLTPNDTGSVYIAPNITFDFSEIQYQQKTPTQSLADWEALFQQLSAHSEVPIIVWPWHDYGATNWPTNGPGTPPPGYTTQMYTDFIAYAFNAGYEFVTEEQLAARIAAQQKATVSETTNGNVITATITPDATAPDLGGMALNVINGTVGQVIQNAGGWYAYDAGSLFLPKAGGTFTVTLGTTQDDVTHIDALPMRADLQSLTGNGSNLTFSMLGNGVVDIHVKTPGANIVTIQGAPTATLNGDDLSLTFNDGPLAISSTSPSGVPVLHNVSVYDGASAVLSKGTNVLFGGSATNTLTLTGLYENYKITLNADGSDTIADTRSGTPDGTDIVHNFQDFKFSDGLVLTTAQLNGSGVLLGTPGPDTLTSALPGEVILGLAGNDTLTAGAINQTLDGGTGSDVLSDAGYSGVTLIGGPGTETFVVTNASTTVVDLLNTTTDTVRTNLATYTMPTNISNLVLFGGSIPQTVTNNSVNDTLTASGYHRDTFIFNQNLQHDQITNFNASTQNNHDNLSLSAALFAPNQTLSVSALFAGTLYSTAGTHVTMTQSAGNAVITFDPQQSITLDHVTLSTLKAVAATDIHFV
jgi:serralysin